MNAHGFVLKYGDNVDTDVIIPARYLNTQEPKELATHCMEDIDKDFVNRVKDGDIMVGGLKLRLRLVARARTPVHQDRRHLGGHCQSLPASSTATAINIGLPIMECPEAVDAITAGGTVNGRLRHRRHHRRDQRQVFHAEPFRPLSRRSSRPAA